MLGRPNLNAAEVAAINETEDALREFESDVDVDAGGSLIGDGKHLFCIGKPEKLAVEFEMQGDDCIWELEEEIFSASFYSEDSLAFGSSCEVGGVLRFCGDRVQDVDAADSLTLDERAEGSCDSFYFGEFGHIGFRLL